MNPNPQSFYTRQALCAELLVSLSTLKRYEASGELRPTRVGPRLVRYCAHDVATFLGRRKRDLPDKPA